MSSNVDLINTLNLQLKKLIFHIIRDKLERFWILFKLDYIIDKIIILVDQIITTVTTNKEIRFIAEIKLSNTNGSE